MLNTYPPTNVFRQSLKMLILFFMEVEGKPLIKRKQMFNFCNEQQ